MALVIAAPFLIAAFLLSLPVVLPIMGVRQARAEKRKRACVERWPCGWCVAPLGAEALARADTLFDAHVHETFGDATFVRLVRDLHACCPRCNAGHRYEEKADRFVLLDRREFERWYGELLGTAVGPATAVLAWPWCPFQPAAHTIALTSDRACNGDDPPNERTLAVPTAVDIAAIAEALLRSPWLAPVGDNATWTCDAGPVALTFGLRSAIPFVRRVGPEPVRADSVAVLHVRYAAQRDSDTLTPLQAERRA